MCVRFDTFNGMPIERSHHLECFAKYPPPPIAAFEEIKWDARGGRKGKGSLTFVEQVKERFLKA